MSLLTATPFEPWEGVSISFLNNELPPFSHVGERRSEVRHFECRTLPGTLLDLIRPQESQTYPAKRSNFISLLQSVPILETALQTYNLRNEEAFTQQRRSEEIRNVSGLSG